MRTKEENIGNMQCDGIRVYAECYANVILDLQLMWGGKVKCICIERLLYVSVCLLFTNLNMKRMVQSSPARRDETQR